MKICADSHPRKCLHTIIHVLNAVTPIDGAQNVLSIQENHIIKKKN